jgi:CrcB protein
METWRDLVWISLGGGVGTAARFAISKFCARWVGEAFPWGTWVVNFSGSFLIGWLAAISFPGGRWTLSPTARQVLMAGFCGGYTTFSAFSLDTLRLWQQRAGMAAVLNVAGSVGACLGAVALGWMAGQTLGRAR